MGQQSEIKAAVRRRYEFIEFSLQWEGAVGRKRLQDQFEMSAQQATKDLTSYSDICPGNLEYDPRKKTYVPTNKFRPKFGSDLAQDYLLQLEMMLLGYRNPDESWIHNFPRSDAVRISSRKIKKSALRTLIGAIHSQRTVTVSYASFNSEQDNLRTISPCALATDGHRWHIRAFDRDKDRYSDFVVSRLQSTVLKEDVYSPPPPDHAWQTKVRLLFEPETSLNAAQKAAVQFEYDMTDGVLELKVRKAMLFYYLRNYGFNPRPLQRGKLKNESSFNLRICNFEEVEECLDRRP